MKSLKTLVCATSFALCFGAVSMANAATIAPAGQGFTTAGSITVTSPASLNLPVTCNIVFTGSVAANGASASITGAQVSGSNALCSVPQLLGLPWTLNVASGGPDAFNGTVSGVNFKILNNCSTSPVTINVGFKNSTNTLTVPSAQTVGSCKITALTATPSPAFTVTP
ncbi:protein activator [Pseudomonas sp. MF6751]|uniref:alkane oxidation protein activator PraB n=1 Tax=Pseudomonas TaxID=286 RepID=UPI00190A1D0F|nr:MULTISPECIES: alkane oxidation protein activator PraB [Pseudomonas]MBK3479456.1 protein activator [Pseudomonas sp. MF6751]MBY8953621.1 protein activator [Pseudomonas carnis]